jgi:protein-tyrosine phosphatase
MEHTSFSVDGPSQAELSPVLLTTLNVIMNHDSQTENSAIASITCAGKINCFHCFKASFQIQEYESMIKVLFVCLGNICRSPMAEAVFRHYVKEAGLADKIAVDSAGTGDWHTGSPPHRGTRNVLTANRISYEGITARQITPSDMKDSHYIIVMDEQNKRDVERLLGYAYGEKRPHIGKLLDFAANAGKRDVPDPYYTGNFEETYELVTDGCRGLLKHIIEKENL